MGFFHRSSSASSSKNPQSASNSSYSPSTGQSGSHSSFDDDNVPIVNLTERRLRDWKINSSSGGGDAASPVSGGSATLPRGTAVGGSRGNLGTAGNNVRFDNSTGGGGGGGSGPSSTNTTGIPTHNRAGQAGSSSSPNNLILLIERGQWAAATDRARTHDHEVRQLVKLRKTTKNLPPPISTDAAVGGGGGGGVISASSAPGNTGTTSTSGSREDVSSKKSNVQISNVKCKALHHACQKLRSVHTTIYQTRVSGGGSGGIAGPIATDDMRIIIEDDEYIEACKCLLTLIRIHPEACRERESRHGCLPLHLCVFSMCDTPPPPAPPITTTPVTIKSSLASSLVDTVAAAASRGSLEIMNGMKDFFGTTAPPYPPQSSSSPAQQQTTKQQNHHRTVRSTSSVDSLGNISQMIQEESEHQRALTYHQLNAKKQQRKLLAGDGGGSSIDELDEIHKGMDDMERLLMGLESRYENEEKGGKDKKKKKRLPSITKVWKGGNNNSSSSADNNNNNNNNNNDFGGGQTVRATSAIPSTSDAAKSTTTIINAMTPLDCLEERSRETDSHSTLRESLRFKDVGGSNGSKGSSQWSSSDEKDKIAKATAAVRHSMAMCSDKDKHRSNTTTAAAGGVASSSSSPSSASLEPTYEDLQRRYLQINTARREEYSVQVINALLDAWPKSVKTSSEGGRLPLHMACFGKATVGVMETILNAYPDAARQRNHDGFLPVHIAAHWGVSHPDIAPLLLRAYPDGAVGRNRWERTPIEEALGMAGENGREHQMSLVWSLRRHPTYWIHNDIGTMLLPRNVRVAPWRMVDVADDGEMSQKNDDNVITSRATVGGAVDVDDVGSSEEEDEGVEVQMKAALSSAALNNNNPSYIRKLAQSTDLSLLITKDKHWAAAALRCRSHPQEAREVMEVKVRGAYTAKITPLHYACENQPSVEVISTLIKANPAALERRQEPGGQLPLHAACTWGASPDVIQALLTALSSCAQMKDFLSNLPLHCACYSGADTKVIELLLSAFPQSVWPRNHQGSSAVDIVRRLSHCNRKETLHLLERTMSRLLVNAAAVEGDGVEVNDSCLEWV